MYVQYVNPIITVVSKVVFKMLCGLRMIEITSQYVRNLQMRQLKDVWPYPRVGGKSQYSSFTAGACGRIPQSLA